MMMAIILTIQKEEQILGPLCCLSVKELEATITRKGERQSRSEKAIKAIA